MLIVDAQAHIWGANTPERPWPARLEAHRDAPIGKDELLREMNAAGVDRVIVVPPSSMFTKEIPWLTSRDKEWIMGRGVCEWVGWKA